MTLQPFTPITGPAVQQIPLPSGALLIVLCNESSPALHCYVGPDDTVSESKGVLFVPLFGAPLILPVSAGNLKNGPWVNVPEGATVSGAFLVA